MLYGELLDLLYESTTNFQYLTKIVKSGFVYDLKYNLVYPTLNQTFQNLLVPKYIQELDQSIIQNTVDINARIYKKYTYINSNFVKTLITDIFTTTEIFENYLKTFEFYDVFKKFISFDFITIIKDYFIKKLAQNIKTIGLTQSFYSLIESLLGVTADNIIEVNRFFRLLYRNDYGLNDANFIKIQNFFQSITLTIPEVIQLANIEYSLVQKTIKSEYFIPNNETITYQNVINNHENLPYDNIYSDITRLEQQANRSILINVNNTSILNHISYETYSLLIEFLNAFQPEYVKIILINIIADNNSFDTMSIFDDLQVQKIEYIPYNIIGYCKIGSTRLLNQKV